MHPFFDAKTFSDDELLKKFNEASSRLRYVQAYIGDQDMINQLELFMESIQLERQERLNKQSWDHWQNQFPSEINTDPEFKKDRKAEERKTSPQGRPDSKFKKPMAPMVFQKEPNPAANPPVKKTGTPPNSTKS